MGKWDMQHIEGLGWALARSFQHIDLEVFFVAKSLNESQVASFQEGIHVLIHCCNEVNKL